MRACSGLALDKFGKCVPDADIDRNAAALIDQMRSILEARLAECVRACMHDAHDVLPSAYVHSARNFRCAVCARLGCVSVCLVCVCARAHASHAACRRAHVL